MPIITVLIYSGRIQKEKNRLAKAFIEDLVKIPEIKKKDIIVVFQEDPHGNWYSSGIRL
jgi:4-oxalocrotonate tautomerase